MSLSQILYRAADLLEPAGAWTQKAVGRDFSGREVECDAPSVVSRCACGAIAVATAEITGDRYSGLYETACAAFRGDPSAAIHFNDAPGRTQAEVVAAIRLAARATTDPSLSPGTHSKPSPNRTTP